jgi:hypothetical protein
MVSSTALAAPILISQRDSSIPPASGGNGDSGMPLVSRDGRYVLFTSAANNLTTNSITYPARLNLFRRDRTNGTTELISVSTAGSLGNGDSLPGGISADGRYVAFESTATNLIANDTNNASDVFVRDTLGETTLLVSKATSGAQGNGTSRSAVITPDGRNVAFVSEASNLVSNDNNGIADIFLTDLQANTTTLVSVGARPKSSSVLKPGSDCPEISDDGRYVAFFSQATNLVSGVLSSSEVYLRDMQANTTLWASSNAQSLFQSVVGTTNVVSCNIALSSDGKHLAYEACTNSVTGANARGLILRYNVSGSTTDLVHTNANVPSNSFADIHNLTMTPDGQFIAFIANASSGNTSAMLWNAQTGDSVLASADLNTGFAATGKCYFPVISTNGNYVAFRSSAMTLSSTPVSAGDHVYVRDVQGATTEVADVDLYGSGSGVASITVPSLSGDGHVVAFEMSNGSLVSDDRNAALDVFARTPQAGTTELISAHAPGYASFSGNNYSQLSALSVSSNGMRIAFISDATDLVPNDSNGQRDVFVRDLSTGMNMLASIGFSGDPASGPSVEPSISGDGRYVAFSSFATNLVAGDTNNAEDVFLRDLQANTTTLISRKLNSTSPGNANSYSPMVSSDGRFVLFRSIATNLASAAFGAGVENLFLRDTQLGTNYALTVASTGTGVSATSMTPDGHYVAFIGLIPGQTTNKIYVWNSLSASRIYTNTATSPALIAISPDGSKLAYASSTIYIVKLAGNTTVSLGALASAYKPYFYFSRDGRYLVYGTGTPSINLHRYDSTLGTDLLVSSGVGTSGTGYSGLWNISQDGRFVAFRSTATNLFSTDGNGSSDVFLFDCLYNSILLLTANKVGTMTANSSSVRPVFSEDGNSVFFQSRASDITLNDFNQSLPDIYAVRFSSSPLADSDGDGMDDSWEMENFGTLARDGTGDSDGDGSSDLAEFQSGTDPNDSQSYFHIEIQPYSPTAAQLRWPATPNPFYRVQFKNALSDSNWQDFAGPASFYGNWGYRATSITATQQFYRVILDK